jgi:hypothetical protein
MIARCDGVIYFLLVYLLSREIGCVYLLGLPLMIVLCSCRSTCQPNIFVSGRVRVWGTSISTRDKRISFRWAYVRYSAAAGLPLE